MAFHAQSLIPCLGMCGLYLSVGCRMEFVVEASLTDPSNASYLANSLLRCLAVRTNQIVLCAGSVDVHIALVLHARVKHSVRQVARLVHPDSSIEVVRVQ